VIFLRKAQGGLNAAILVAVIAGLIILYILFLPEDEREALLENKTVKKSGADDKDEDILLREFPGRLDTIDEIEDKQLPNVFLFETTNAKELERINPFIIRSGVFDKDRQSRTITFSLDDLENTDNILLSFRVAKHKGILTIELNNNIIFESDIESTSVDPIGLKADLLNNQNTLEFSVSSVGFRFWRTNEYSFEGMKLIGDITDRSKQESRNVFTITSRDLFNIEEANLRFVPYCGNVADVGVLDIEINNKNVFSAVPVCEDAYKQPIPLGILNTGENRIIFRTNKGSYSVEQIKIEFEEEDVIEEIFFFEINQSTLDDIEDEDLDVILTIEFVDDKRTKRANLNINDRFIIIDEDEKFFTKNLNDFVEEGNNFIELEPRTRLDIVEIRVELEDT